MNACKACVCMLIPAQLGYSFQRVESSKQCIYVIVADGFTVIC